MSNMKQCCKTILFAITLLLLLSPVIAQPSAHGDSLIFYLQKIKNAADTITIITAYEKMYAASENALLDDNIATQIINLKTKVDDRDYYDLISSYFLRLITLNTKNTNEKAILVGNRFIKNYGPGISKYGHYSLLYLFRNIRLPFRALGKLNESIEYYATAEIKYLAVHDSDAISICENVLSGSYDRLGLIEKSSYYQLKSISYLNDKQEDYNLFEGALLFGKAGKVNRYAVLGSYYITQEKPQIAEPYLLQVIKFYNELDSPILVRDAPFLFLQMARCKTLQKSDSSAYYYDKALQYLQLYKSPPIEYAHYYQEKAVDFISKHQLDSAIGYIDKASQLKDSFNLPLSSYFGELLPEYYRGSVYILQGKAKEAIKYLERECNSLKQLSLRSVLTNCLYMLSKAYTAAGDHSNAYKTLNQAFELKEQTTREINDARTQDFETEKKMQEKENALLVLESQNESNKKTKYYLTGILLLLATLAIFLAVFYSNKRKSNRQLTVKNKKLANALDQLKSTQSQLIQSEKMASLGELTAGIAHEIQNPLNFVNNFSDVNKELLTEMKDEMNKGNIDDANSIADDVIANEEKINQHGKRAADIVKGMLQHSRKSEGKKELTDINALCDEYLRLAYHGLRAKDKTFNAEMKTNFDESIDKINIIPQDMGRVILNLITNAFYAVNEKKKTVAENYQPLVSVQTKKSGDKIEISVSDNGNGIPDAIKDKIFQPFFTTKPTGSGTGLGLSLSYDIVKTHGGEIKVESKEGEGSKFIIQIPGE